MRRPPRPQQPTILFRLIFALAFLTLSSSELARHEPAGILVDTMTTASLTRAGAIPVHVNRALKGDLLLPPRARIAEAGIVVKTAAVFGPAIIPPRPAPAPPKPVIAAPDVAAPEPAAIAVSASAEIPLLRYVPPEPAPMPPVPPVAAKAAAPPAPVLLAYAPAKNPADDKAPFDAVIAKPKVMSTIVVPNVDANHAWVNDPLPASVHKESEIRCLANAIYFEARGEPVTGQLAVAQVVLNRVKNPAYPDTICSVVYQNKNKRYRCQFSFACDGIRDRITDMSAWNAALSLARKVVANPTGTFLADVGTSTHYHATYVRPRWARKMKKMDKIGRHIFYKTYGGGWS